MKEELRLIEEQKQAAGPAWDTVPPVKDGEGDGGEEE